MNEFEAQYMDTAIWADKPEGEHWEDAEWSDEAIAIIKADCEKFQEQAAEWIGDRGEDEAAHDFWLTRQGHGAGFWDGDWPEPAASKLTELSKQFGETWLYLGDDGEIHFG